MAPTPVSSMLSLHTSVTTGSLWRMQDLSQSILHGTGSLASCLNNRNGWNGCKLELWWSRRGDTRSKSTHHAYLWSSEHHQVYYIGQVSLQVRKSQFTLAQTHRGIHYSVIQGQGLSLAKGTLSFSSNYPFLPNLPPISLSRPQSSREEGTLCPLTGDGHNLTSAHVALAAIDSG